MKTILTALVCAFVMFFPSSSFAASFTCEGTVRTLVALSNRQIWSNVPYKVDKPIVAVDKTEAVNARVDNPESADDVEFRRTVVPKYVKQLANKTICGAIRKVAVDGIPRTGRELFALVSPEMPNVEFASFRACINKAGLCSGPSGRPRKERIFWLPKDDRTSTSTGIVQSPIDESDYPVDKLIWRLMSDGKPRTKSEIYEYVLRFNKTATAAIVARQIVWLGLVSEMNGTDRVYRSPRAGSSAAHDEQSSA